MRVMHASGTPVDMAGYECGERCDEVTGTWNSGTIILSC
jgi:hypothetical protein